MKTKLTLVTPKLAAQWLETNYCNRPISRNYVEELARSLTQGTFRTTHQGVAFDEQGRLRDGQHRLTAIVQTGVSVTMLIASGLTEEELQAIDDGRKRTAHQVLSMLGDEKVTSFASAVAREMLAGGWHLKDGVRPRKPSRQDLIDFYQRHYEAIRYAERHFRDHESGLSVGYIAAPVARAWYVADQARLDRFTEVLTTGYSREGEEGIIRLRNYILRARRDSPRGQAVRDDIYAKISKTLKDWLEGVPFKNVSGVKDELFPLPEEAAQAAG